MRQPSKEYMSQSLESLLERKSGQFARSWQVAKDKRHANKSKTYFDNEANLNC
jgi:hypothetical protein